MGYSNYIEEIIGFWIGYVVMLLDSPKLFFTNGRTGQPTGEPAADDQQCFILRK